MEEEMQQIQAHTEFVVQFLVENGSKIISALIIVGIGWFFSGWLKGFLLKRFEKRNLDPTLSRFFAGSARVMILAIGLTFAVAKFYNIAPLIAGLGAIAFGATLAIQGPISNYGAGLAIILTRPFVVHDTILVQGQYGVVHEVSLGVTRLITEDNEVITIPNKLIMGEIFTNSRACRIVEATLSIPADADAQRACQVMTEAIGSIEGVAGDPAPMIGIDEFREGTIRIGYRYWLPTERYHALRFQVNGAIDAAFRAAGIPLAIPPYEVRMRGPESKA
ncbi:MAG: mechanosensitive ion channel family protein [Verrucomicrobiota bacterium JB024]|jgi:small conductance mechanosensitive channel|nr:mechanosensitive ion channel family protein [Verrucomicrobiota bacterium JB024]